MKHYLAFDLGASSSRAVLGTLAGDVMHLEELHRFVTPILEQGGHLFWDLDTMWDELLSGLRKALDVAPGLRSLSVDSWGVDYVPMDAAGMPLRNPYGYRDTRTEGVMEHAFERLPADQIYAYTGIQFLPFNTLYQLLAEAQHDPKGLRQTALHLTIADYFNYRFSGQPVIEVSMASTTQLMDVHTRQWSEPLMQAFGLDPKQWPAIVPSGARLGPVIQAPGVTALATCSHDTGSAIAATPATSEDWVYISCGTWSLLGVERHGPLLTDDAREAGFTHEAGVDGTIRFLKNLTGLWTLQECAREWRERGVDADWSTLEEEARRAAPNQVFIDLEDPRFLSRGGMESRLRGYCREHGLQAPASRGGLVRLILESIAASYRRELPPRVGQPAAPHRSDLRDHTPLRRWRTEQPALSTHC